MMENIYQSNFLAIDYQQEHSLFTFTWNENSMNLDDELLKGELLKEVECCKQYRVKRLLIDTVFFQYALSPEMQTWMDVEIFAKCMEYGVNKIAVVLSKDLFAMVSIDQVMNEELASNIQSKSFDDKKAAHRWLIST